MRTHRPTQTLTTSRGLPQPVPSPPPAGQPVVILPSPPPLAPKKLALAAALLSPTTTSRVFPFPLYHELPCLTKKTKTSCPKICPLPHTIRWSSRKWRQGSLPGSPWRGGGGWRGAGRGLCVCRRGCGAACARPLADGAQRVDVHDTGLPANSANSAVLDTLRDRHGVQQACTARRRASRATAQCKLEGRCWPAHAAPGLMSDTAKLTAHWQAFAHLKVWVGKPIGMAKGSAAPTLGDPARAG